VTRRHRRTGKIAGGGDVTDEQWDEDELDCDYGSDKETIQSCERCGVDVCEEDGYVVEGSWYCDMCAWWLLQA